MFHEYIYAVNEKVSSHNAAFLVEWSSTPSPYGPSPGLALTESEYNQNWRIWTLHLEMTLLLKYRSFSISLFCSTPHSFPPTCLIIMFCFFIFSSLWKAKCSSLILLCSSRDCLAPSPERSLPSSRPLSFFLPQIICWGVFISTVYYSSFFFFPVILNLFQAITILHRQYAICISYLCGFFSFKWG